MNRLKICKPSVDRFFRYKTMFFDIWVSNSRIWMFRIKNETIAIYILIANSWWSRTWLSYSSNRSALYATEFCSIFTRFDYRKSLSTYNTRFFYSYPNAFIMHWETGKSTFSRTISSSTNSIWNYIKGFTTADTNYFHNSLYQTLLKTAKEFYE